MFNDAKVCNAVLDALGRRGPSSDPAPSCLLLKLDAFPVHALLWGVVASALVVRRMRLAQSEFEQ